MVFLESSKAQPLRATGKGLASATNLHTPGGVDAGDGLAGPACHSGCKAACPMQHTPLGVLLSSKQVHLQTSSIDFQDVLHTC